MRFILASALIPLLAACATMPPPADITPKAYVIRHFQKEGGSNPALTVEGQANALRLAARLAGEKIVAVYSTDTRRARESAIPAATRHKLIIALYPPMDIDALSVRIAEQPGSVLIVGHSNTVPIIVERLSGTLQPPMDESRYGDLFIVDLTTRAVRAERIGN